MSASREQSGSATPAHPRSAPGCGFVLLWIILNFAGAILGLTIGGMAAFLLSLVFRVLSPVTVNSVISLGIIGIALVTSGAVIGSAQWLALRGQFGLTAKWIGATALGWTGWGIVMLLGVYLPGLAGRGGGAAFQVLLAGLTVACAGAILGSAQWLILQIRVKSADSWVVISTFAWVLGSLGAAASYFVGAQLPGLNRSMAVGDYSAFILLPFSLSLAYLLVSGITGLGLAWLLRTSTSLPQD